MGSPLLESGKSYREQPTIHLIQSNQRLLGRRPTINRFLAQNINILHHIYKWEASNQPARTPPRTEDQSSPIYYTNITKTKAKPQQPSSTSNLIHIDVRPPNITTTKLTSSTTQQNFVFDTSYTDVGPPNTTKLTSWHEILPSASP